MAIGVAGYIPYLWSTIRGAARPHAYTWLIWSLLTGVMVYGQIIDGAGPGAWVNATTLVGCAVIFTLAVRQRDCSYDRFDRWTLAAALSSIFLVLTSKSPLLGVLLATLTDLIGYVPTFRKVRDEPDSENTAHYLMAAAKCIVAVPALANLTLVTTLPLVAGGLPPAVLALYMIRRRRRHLGPGGSTTSTRRKQSRESVTVTM